MAEWKVRQCNSKDVREQLKSEKWRVRKGGDNGGVWTNRRGAGKEDNATSTNQNTGPDKALVCGAQERCLW